VLQPLSRTLALDGARACAPSELRDGRLESRHGGRIQGDDRVGAIAEICEKLAGAGINMTAMDAVSTGDGRYGAIFWVNARDINKAAKVLGAS